ncbi:hypothetical protein WJX82_001621 [Trebouxia sp. C0006]
MHQIARSALTGRLWQQARSANLASSPSNQSLQRKDSNIKVKMILAESLAPRLLAKTAARALCTAYARGVSVPMQFTRNSMTSTQGALCFSHCKASPHKPSPMHALPVLPMCARLHHFCHGYSHLSKQQSWNIVHCQLITSDAESGSAGKAAAVQAEFAKAGIPTRGRRDFRAWPTRLKIACRLPAGVCIEEIDAPVLRLAAVSSIPLLQQILLPALNSLLSVQCAPVDKLTLSDDEQEFFMPAIFAIPWFLGQRAREQRQRKHQARESGHQIKSKKSK